MGLLDAFRTRAVATVPELANNVVHSNLATTPLLGPVSQYLSSTLTTADPIPTESGLLSIASAWRAVNMIANANAIMLTGADVVSNTGKELTVPQLVKRPNALYGAYDFWYEATVTALMHGNYIAIKTDYDLEGYATQVVPVHPYHVECRIAANGLPVYKIREDYYSHTDVIHVRGLTVPGQWWGIGVIEALRKTVVGAIDLQNFANNTYRTGGAPTVAIKLKNRNVTQDQAQSVADAFNSAYSQGVRKAIAYNDTEFDIEQFTWSPVDAAFLQSRSFSVAEIAFAFGLDPSDLGTSVGDGGSSLNYANIEQRNIERILSSYGPWLRRFEQAWTDALPDGQTVTGNVEALLRTDSTTRLKYLADGVAAKFWTVEYAQDKQNIDAKYRPSQDEPSPLPVSPAVTESDISLKEAA